MYKTISNKIIRTFDTWYDQSEVITDKNEELSVKQWVEKYRNVIPSQDIIRILLRKEFLSEKDLRLFAVWCAREALKLIENPDKRSIEACNVAEKLANGEATKEELFAAYIAAYDAAYAVATATDYTGLNASHASTLAAYYAAAYASASANYYVTKAAYYAAYAVAYADSDVDYYVARDLQLDQLLTYFE